MRKYDFVKRAAVSSIGVGLLFLSRVQTIVQPFNYMLIGLGCGAVLVAVLFPLSGNDLIEEINRLDSQTGSSAMKFHRSEMVISLFDKLIGEYGRANGVRHRRKLIGKLRPVVYDICNLLRNWEGELRIRVHILVRMLGRFIGSPNEIDDTLSLLIIVMLKAGEPAIEMIKSMLAERLESAYNDSTFEESKLLPIALIIINRDDHEFVFMVLDDAIHFWQESRYRALVQGFRTIGRFLPKKEEIQLKLMKELAKSSKDGKTQIQKRAREMLTAIHAAE